MLLTASSVRRANISIVIVVVVVVVLACRANVFHYCARRAPVFLRVPGAQHFE